MIEKLKVLVLNQSYEPMHFCTAKRAVVMLMNGRARQVERDGVMLRSFSGSMPCPTVIRLNRYIHIPRGRVVPFSKKNVLRRDGHTCQYCGRTGEPLTIDHIIPRSAGGESTWLNVVAACRKCNIGKGSRTPEEAGLTLRTRPYRPQYIHFLTAPASAPDTFKTHWQKYLTN